MYGPPLGCKRKMKVTICGLRKCIRPCLSKKAQGLDGDAPRFRPTYFDSLEGHVNNNRFRERWVRPFCHLKVREQTWQMFFQSLLSIIQSWFVVAGV
jgi:hypothetical protein